MQKQRKNFVMQSKHPVGYQFWFKSDAESVTKMEGSDDSQINEFDLFSLE